MSSDHWPQFYQQSPPTIYSVAGDSVSDSTVVTTSAPTAATTGHNLTIPEGRIAKPIRRRSRASRRTPTTLLNTDTTNFRAMVQQFTGGPSAPYGTASSQLNTHSFSFAMNSNNNNNTNPRQGHVINPGGVMINPNSGFHIQYQNNQNQQQQQSQVQVQQNPYMFSLGANSSASTGGGGQGDIHHDFFQRIISSGTAEEGVPATRAPPSSENRSNSFLF